MLIPAILLLADSGSAIGVDDKTMILTSIGTIVAVVTSAFLVGWKLSKMDTRLMSIENKMWTSEHQLRWVMRARERNTSNQVFFPEPHTLAVDED